MEEKARETLEQAEQCNNTGQLKEAKAWEFVAQTYTATVTALMNRAIADPLASA